MRELGKNGPPVTRGTGIRYNTHESKVTNAPSPLEFRDLYLKWPRKRRQSIIDGTDNLHNIHALLAKRRAFEVASVSTT